MSRSYRKFPSCKMTLWGKHSRSTKPGKQYANRKIRRKLRNPNIEISNGRYYKFLGLDSWDLWEFNFYKTKKEVINEWEKEHCHTLTLEEEIQDWKKYYLRK